MNKKLLNIIIGLMSLVLTGLLIIQIIWINRAVALKEQQFSQNVHDALSEVAFMLEREEAYNVFKSRFSNNPFFNLNNAADRNWFEEQLSFFTDSIAGKGNQVVFKLDTTYLLDSMGNSGYKSRLHIQIEDSVEPLQEIDAKMKTKKAMMNDIIQDFFGSSGSIENRVEKKQLQLLIQQSLRQHGIKTPFEFLVKDAFGQTIVNSNPKDTVKKGTIYQITLFPSDIFSDPNYLFVHFPNQKKYILSSLGILTFVSLLFVMLIVVCFGYVVHIIFQQKKLSDMKTDFINNMTHELKTPVATISLASEMLKKQDIIENKDKSLRYAGIIYDENKRLGQQVEKVLQMAVLDKGDFQLKKTFCDIHGIIHKVVDKLSLQIESTNGKINLQLDAKDSATEVDEVHFTNIIFNLLDNAIKYSLQNPEIVLSTRNMGSHIVISVTDNGIGMNKEAQKRIFEKFYRVPTGNIHNVKGFGLGLSYVKIMVEAHQGDITVTSEPGKGSTFEITLPVLKPKDI